MDDLDKHLIKSKEGGEFGEYNITLSKLIDDESYRILNYCVEISDSTDAPTERICGNKSDLVSQLVDLIPTDKMPFVRYDLTTIEAPHTKAMWSHYEVPVSIKAMNCFKIQFDKEIRNLRESIINESIDIKQKLSY